MRSNPFVDREATHFFVTAIQGDFMDVSKIDGPFDVVPGSFSVTLSGPGGTTFIIPNWPGEMPDIGDAYKLRLEKAE